MGRVYRTGQYLQSIPDSLIHDGSKGQLRVETVDLKLPLEDVVLTYPIQLK